jgi:hypothetical protein
MKCMRNINCCCLDRLGKENARFLRNDRCVSPQNMGSFTVKVAVLRVELQEHSQQRPGPDYTRIIVASMRWRKYWRNVYDFLGYGLCTVNERRNESCDFAWKYHPLIIAARFSCGHRLHYSCQCSVYSCSTLPAISEYSLCILCLPLPSRWDGVDHQTTQKSFPCSHVNVILKDKKNFKNWRVDWPC